MEGIEMRFLQNGVLDACLIAAMLVSGASAGQCQSRKSLTAPTYYLAIKGSLESSDAIRVRGATNLPPGAEIWVGIGQFVGDFGLQPYTDGGCATVRENGLFELELHPISGMKFRRSLIAVAGFCVNGGCKQPKNVLAIVGKKGQHLGNDNYDDAMDTTMAETPGMFENPQLSQSSGWYFGLEAMNRVE
jgi:hypothetical protein